VSDARGYRREIDGLRAVAVLAVVIYHACPDGLPGGFVGVDIFFVISGYLITGILQRAVASGAFSFADFYGRRIRRIFPALIVVLLASLVAGWFMLLPLRYASLGKHVVGAAGFVANFVVWGEAGYFDAHAVEKPLLHLWSLGIEEQFYVVWPFLLWLLGRLRVAAVWPLLGLCVLSFVASVVLTTVAPDAAFYLPASRMWELGLGGVLACWPLRVRFGAALTLVGLGAIAVALVAFTGDSPYPGWRALLPVLGTCVVIAAGDASTPSRWLLGNPVAVALGLISYPLYLWHWVLLSFGHLTLVAEPPLLVRLGLVVASVVLATLTYLLVERPIRSRRVTARQAVALAMTLALLASAGHLVDHYDGVLERFPSETTVLLDYQYEFSADAHVGECWISATDPGDGFKPSCFPAPTEARPVILMWGDSHAARLRPGVDHLLGDAFFIGSATRNLCAPSLRAADQCAAGNEVVLATIARTRPALVVMFAHWPVYTADIIEDAVRTSARAHEAGARRVLVVGPAPEWNKSLPVMIYEAWLDGSPYRPFPRRLANGQTERVVALDQQMKAMPWGEGVTYVSLLDLLCDREGCLTYVPETADDLVAYDYGHLTTAGAIYVVRQLHLDQLGKP